MPLISSRRHPPLEDRHGRRFFGTAPEPRQPHRQAENSIFATEGVGAVQRTRLPNGVSFRPPTEDVRQATSLPLRRGAELGVNELTNKLALR